MPPIAASNERRAAELRRFRNYALFWIIILVAYFIGADIVLEFMGSTLESASPVLLLLLGCIVIASVWHAAAIVTMSHPNWTRPGGG
jgi:hypothetical protein